MVRRCLACVVVVACSSVAMQAYAGPRAFIELFTSQGCSSCPPADKLLGQLAADPSLVAMSLPIDYWDYLGWKDTLADPRNTARQRGYSKQRGDGEVYTPQVVVNGAMHVLGSDREMIEQGIGLVRQHGATLSLPVSASAGDGRLVVKVGEAIDGHGSADVWICGLVKTITVAIGRGENRGKTLTYHNVVRHWFHVGNWNGTAQTFSVAVHDFDGNGVDGAAVVVQSGTVEKPGTVLGATMAGLH